MRYFKQTIHYRNAEFISGRDISNMILVLALFVGLGQAAMLGIPYTGGKLAGTQKIQMTSYSPYFGLQYSVSPDSLQFGNVFSLKLGFAGGRPPASLCSTADSEFTKIYIRISSPGSMSRLADSSAPWQSLMSYPPDNQLVRLDTLVSGNGTRVSSAYLLARIGTCEGTGTSVAPGWNRVIFVKDGSRYSKVAVTAKKDTAYGTLPWYSFIQELTVTYVVNDTNDLGSTQINGSAPGAPTGVAAVFGNTQVTVVWSAPSSSGTAPISSYMVTAVEDTSKHCGTTSTPPATPALTCILTGLTNGTAYSFTVTATNSMGTGPASAPSTTVIPHGDPGTPGAPLNVSGTPGNGRVAVVWSAPSSNGGSAITGYTVTSNPDSKTCTTTGALTCVDSTLTNGTSYTFTVTATNAVGTGPAGSSGIVVPFTVPGCPLGVTWIQGDGQAVVSWMAPASNGGSAITGYKVIAVQDTTKTCTTTGALTCTVTGLTAGVYAFHVRAINAAGAGNACVINGILDFSARNGFEVHMTGSSVVFHLPSGLASGARVSVMDIRGRTVWSQIAGPGVRELYWNGKTERGSLTCGLFFARIADDVGRKSRVLAESKFILLP